MLMVTGCTGTGVVATNAKPAVVSSAPDQPASTGAQASTAAQQKPAAAAADSECPALTASDVKAITGQDVHPIAHMPFANIVQCGNYAVDSGKQLVAINMVKSASSYQSELKSVPNDMYPQRVDLPGIGDEAVLFKSAPGGTGSMRYLLARKGDKGVILMPFTAAKDVTDEMLTKMLETAISRI